MTPWEDVGLPEDPEDVSCPLHVRIESRNSTEFWRCSGRSATGPFLSLSSSLRDRGINRATLKLCGVCQLKRVTGGLLAFPSSSLTVSFLFCVRLRFISDAVPGSYRRMFRGEDEGAIFIQFLSVFRRNTMLNRDRGVELAI